MNPGALESNGGVDSTALSQEGGGRAFRYLVMALCGAVAFVEGFDTQSVGFVAPSIARAFQMKPDLLGLFFSVGLFGLMGGALGFAPLADRYGRKPLILLGTLGFGLSSLCIALVGSVQALFVLRFLTGLGLGAVMPNLIALTAEYSPSRSRGFGVMLMFNGFTLGSIASGFVAAALVGRYGWQTIFVLGGAIPLVMLPALVAFLPESLVWLASDRSRVMQARRLLQRAFPEMAVDPDASFMIDGTAARRSSLVELFRDRRTAKTLLLWTIFFTSLLDLYLLVSWLPTIVASRGFGQGTAAIVGVMFQVGGIVGMFPIAWLSDRGAPARILAAVYLVAALAIPLVGLASGSLWSICAMAFLAGVGILGGQNAANALAAACYPTRLRATAVGSALGVGRIGSIIGPIVAGVLIRANVSPRDILLLAGLPALITAAAAYALHWRAPDEDGVSAPLAAAAMSRC